MFANSEPGSGGLNRAELAADFQRRVRFRIEELQLARCAIKVQDDTSLGLTEPFAGCGGGGWRPTKGCAQKSKATGPQHIAARPATGESVFRSKNAQHKEPLAT